jgi:hypothetical protein
MNTASARLGRPARGGQTSFGNRSSDSSIRAATSSAASANPRTGRLVRPTAACSAESRNRRASPNGWSLSRRIPLDGLPGRSENILDANEHRELVHRRGNEAAVPIVTSCCVVDRVHENRAHPDRTRSYRATQEGILKKGCAEAASLMPAVDGQASEKNYRHRIGHVPAKPRRRLGQHDGTRHQRVVADDSQRFGLRATRRAGR